MYKIKLLIYMTKNMTFMSREAYSSNKMQV